MSQASFYPPSPSALPENFTKLPSSYKLKASLAIGAIILFIFLYTALVAALGWLTYYAFIYEITSINKLTILLKIGAIAGAGMLIVFTVKFIFKLKNTQPVNRIKIDLESNPKLKHFVMQICKETGAPQPKNVYADPDVNAYVSYTNMWMSLFLPTRKNLTIGLGLVSCLNLSEFKAVIAHEFGHFSQRSTKIGSYIISANTIIHDMIY
ncbi:MAG: M48 family metalloprotease [Nonlabens sp.]